MAAPGPMARRIAGARSLLFVPGDRPERFDPARASGADLVIVDLEDAVAPPNKPAARGHVATLAQTGAEFVVRINHPRSPVGRADLTMLAASCPPGAVGVMIPKAEDADTLRAVQAELGTSVCLVPLVETAAGVKRAAALCAVPEVVRLAFGHLDLCAELGIDPDRRDLLVPARFALVAASAEHGLAPPIDGVCAVVGDAAAIEADTRESVAGGFTGRLAIHPLQVSPIHEALRPSEDAVAWASRILVATAAHAVTVVDGQMVDRPVLLRARAILMRAGAGDPGS
ncbi:MAG: citrate lyase subunit beta / citryl-CoA lyase [Pseudonocardiales bacterium]|nr:citrate lyase subunit beta / citryl-CoA lyase [Pseudonocardiales bacterium]